MKSRSRHKPTQDSSALQRRLHKQEAWCQKTHSCSPSSVWARSHLECIVAEEMAGETTYDHMMLCRRLSSPLTRADLPSLPLPSPGPPYSSSIAAVYPPDLLFAPLLSERCDGGCKNGPGAKCLATWMRGNGFNRDEFSEKNSPTRTD